MTGQGGSGKFIAKKVRKIRWKPKSDTSQTTTNIFVTGSWDDESNEVSVWKCPSGADTSEAEPSQLTSLPHTGDVTDMSWLNPDTFLASSSSGGLVLYRLVRESSYQLGGMKLEVGLDWPVLHKSGGGCTALSCHGDHVVTAGEDGKINLLTSKQRPAVRVFEKADSCSITDITFTRASEVVSSNMRGQLKLWDLRSNQQQPTSTFLLSSDQVAVTCLATHPTQCHILVSGGEDGVLGVWDLRQGRYPVTLLSAHQSPVSEVTFHQDQPDHLFTCSQGGEVWHWNGASIKRGTNTSLLHNASLDNLNATSPWLSTEAVKHKVETHSLVTKQPLPVNSVDVLGQSVIFGGDNEAFYILNNILL